MSCSNGDEAKSNGDTKEEDTSITNSYENMSSKKSCSSNNTIGRLKSEAFIANSFANDRSNFEQQFRYMGNSHGLNSSCNNNSNNVEILTTTTAAAIENGEARGLAEQSETSRAVKSIGKTEMVMKIGQIHQQGREAAEATVYKNNNRDRESNNGEEEGRRGDDNNNNINNDMILRPGAFAATGGPMFAQHYYIGNVHDSENSCNINSEERFETTATAMQSIETGNNATIEATTIDPQKEEERLLQLVEERISERLQLAAKIPNSAVVQEMKNDTNILDDIVCSPPKEKVRKRKRRTECLYATVISFFIVVVMFIFINIFSFYCQSRKTVEEQKLEFDKQFENLAQHIISVVQDNAQNSINAIEQFAYNVGTATNVDNHTWPFVTYPNFAAKSDRLWKLTKAKYITMIPIIQTQADRDRWLNYSISTRLDSLREDIRYMGYENNLTAESYAGSVAPFIFNVNITTGSPSREDGPPPWMPISQQYPFHQDYTSIINYNVMSIESVNATVQSSLAISAPVMNFFSKQINFHYDFDDLKEHEAPIYNPVSSQIMQPIFKQEDQDKRQDDNGELKSRSIVAFVGLEIDWKNYFERILPENSNGFVVVLKQNCVSDSGIDSISYEINGPNVEYLGVGDLHDPAYDDMGISELLVEMYDKSLPSHDMGISELLVEMHDKVPPLNINPSACFTNLTINVYPSKKLEEKFS